MGRNRVRNTKLPQHLYEKDGRYYIRLQVHGEAICRAAGTDLALAKELLRELEGDAQRGRLGLERRPKPVTLNKFKVEYLEWAEAHKKSWKRDVLSLKHLLPAFGGSRLTDISKARVETYMRDRLKEGAKGPTVNREVACLRKMMSLAVERGYLVTNHLARIQMFPESAARQPVLTAKDERRLLMASPEWLRWVIRLAIATGCRRGELLGLKWKHVDLENSALIIEDSKSGDSRRVPIHPQLAKDLEDRMGKPDEPIITLDGKVQPHKDWIAHKFIKVVDKLGLDLRYHDLRHVSGSRLLSTGANLPEVATFLGHKTLTMARRYAHTNWNRLQDLVAQVPVQKVKGPVVVQKNDDPESKDTPTKKSREARKVRAKDTKAGG